jgi:ribosome-binding factor A
LCVVLFYIIYLFNGDLIMKVYAYTYYDSWGAGQGIVVAESIEDADKMLREPHSEKVRQSLFPELRFEEIDITKPQVIDHSWSE